MSEQPVGPISPYLVCVVPRQWAPTWEGWAARGSNLTEGYRLKPAAAQECVKQMRQALDDLGDLRRDLDAMRILPNPLDEVSRNFTWNCAAAIQSAQSFFTAWSAQLKHAIDAMEKQITSYELVEERNRQRTA